MIIITACHGRVIAAAPLARVPPFCSLRNIEQAIFLHIARAKLPAADGCVIVQVSVRQAKLRHSSEVAAAAPGN